jgi:AcrR family transcriptional regulator
MQRPGGRTEAVRMAVASTVLDLIREGHLDFTFLHVAELSGVGRRTVHRRWPNRLALLREALAEHHNTFKVQFGGSFEEDLYRIAVAFRDFSKNPYEIALNKILATTKDVEYRREVEADFENAVSDVVRARLQTALDAGEINAKADVEMVWTMLSCTIFTYCSMLGRPPDGRQLHRMVSALLRICKV